MFSQISQLNFIAVFVAALSAFVISFLLYLPPVFGLRWATLTKQYTGLTDAELGANIPRKAALWFAGYLVNAIVLALLLGAANATTLMDGIQVGILASLGFGAVLSSWPPIHANQPWGVWWMNNGVYLLAQIAMAVILTAWK